MFENNYICIPLFLFFRRLDYFIVSENLMKKICDNVIRNEVAGSDHCPITLFLNL